MIQAMTMPASLTAENGSSVALRAAESGEVLETRDQNGRLVFEFDTVTGKGVLHLGGTALALSARGGSVEVAAPNGLKLRAGGALELQGERVTLASGTSSLDLAPRSLSLKAQSLKAKAGRTSWTGRSMTAKVEELRLSCGRIERVVGRLVEFADNVYQRVEGLFHVRASRVRMEAERSMLLQGESADLEAQGDVRIQGESVNLG